MGEVPNAWMCGIVFESVLSDIICEVSGFSCGVVQLLTLL